MWKSKVKKLSLTNRFTPKSTTSENIKYQIKVWWFLLVAQKPAIITPFSSIQISLDNETKTVGRAKNKYGRTIASRRWLFHSGSALFSTISSWRRSSTATEERRVRQASLLLIIWRIFEWTIFQIVIPTAFFSTFKFETRFFEFETKCRIWIRARGGT